MAEEITKIAIFRNKEIRKVIHKNDSYCVGCLNYIHKEVPQIEAEKIRLGVKCKCVDPSCSKCLVVNCKDDNCPVHTKEQKSSRRKYYGVNLE